MFEKLTSLLRRPQKTSISVLDRRSTLSRVVKENISIARFGDGEISYALERRSLKFQKWDRTTARRLRRALLDPPADMLPCFNHSFAREDHIRWIVAYERYPKTYSAYQTSKSENDIGILERPSQRHTYKAWWNTVSKLTSAREYGDATVFFLGAYVDEYAGDEIESVLSDFRALFNGRRILFVGPDEPLGGLSFRNQREDLVRIGLRSADFISIPRENAASHISEISREILSRGGFDDIFVQAGPAASILAAELAGRTDGRILDVGSLNTQIRYLL